MLRNEIKKDSEIGKKITNSMNDGKFVNDEIVNMKLLKLKQYLILKKKIN